MNTKILLGLTLAAILTTVVAFPAVADAITGIKKTEIKANSEEIGKLKFQLESEVPTTPFGGYAIFTDEGAVVAVTSHGGFFDSTGQQAPIAEHVALQVGAIAAVCTDDAEGCGNEWHTHLVIPDIENEFCDFAAIAELTYNQPSEKLNIAGKNIDIRNVDIGTEGFIGAISGELMDFVVGDPLEGGTAFDLNPALNCEEELAAICIGDVSELDCDGE